MIEPIKHPIISFVSKIIENIPDGYDASIYYLSDLPYDLFTHEDNSVKPEFNIDTFERTMPRQ